MPGNRFAPSSCAFYYCILFPDFVQFKSTSETHPTIKRELNHTESTTNEPAIGMLKVLALRSIPLPSGTIPLYPIVDMIEMSGIQHHSECQSQIFCRGKGKYFSADRDTECDEIGTGE
jgi:hypothetical protein